MDKKKLEEPITRVQNKKLLTWLAVGVSALLIGVIVLIIVLSGGGAEPEGSGSVTPSSSSDSALIKNGDFKTTFITTPNGVALYPMAPQDWTSEVKGDVIEEENENSETPDKVYTGPLTRYGIVDVSDDAYAKITKDEIGSIAAKNDDGTDNPGVYNPKKPVDSASAQDGVNNILWLYSEKDAGIQYKSTSFYIEAGKYFAISVWVQTRDLPAGNGAHVMIKTSGEDQSLIFSQINTETDGAKDGNGWVEYKFFVSTSLTSGQSIYLYLSLGYQDKVGNNTASDYTSGYAFFSDVKAEEISMSEYNVGKKKAEAYDKDPALPDADTHYKHLTLRNDTPVIEKYYKNGKFEYPVDINSTNGKIADAVLTGSQNVAGGYAPFASPSPSGDRHEVVNFTDAEFTDYFLKHPFPTEIEVDESGNKVTKDTAALMIYNAEATSYGYKFTDKLTVGIFKYYKISVWVKTDAMPEDVGANIYLVNDTDPDKSLQFNAIDTETRVSDTYKLSYNGGWVEYSFYVGGASINKYDFHLELWLGQRDGLNERKNKAAGHAFFANITLLEITLNEFNGASGNDVTKSMSLSAKTSSTVSNGNFNTPTNNNQTVYPLAPQSWNYFYTGHTSLSDLNDDEYLKGGVKDEDGNFKIPAENGDTISGIVNENAVRDMDTADFDKLINVNRINGGQLWTNADAFISCFPGSTGPNALMIYNTVPTAAGYRSAEISLSASSYYRISVKIKTYGVTGAGAGIYLTGVKDEDEHDAALSAGKSFTGINTETLVSGALYGTLFEKITLLENGWAEYSFLIETGEYAKTCNLELWLGGRAYKEDGANFSGGAVFFDRARIITLTEDDFKKFKDAEDADNTIYDADGNVKFENLKFLSYTDEKLPEEEEEPEPSPAPANGDKAKFDWLVFSSLILGIALVAALGATIYRKLTKNIRRNKKLKLSGNYKRRSPGKARSAKKQKDYEEYNFEDEPETGSETETPEPAAAPRKKPAKPAKEKPEEPEVSNDKITPDDEL